MALTPSLRNSSSCCVSVLCICCVDIPRNCPFTHCIHAPRNSRFAFEEEELTNSAPVQETRSAAQRAREKRKDFFMICKIFCEVTQKIPYHKICQQKRGLPIGSPLLSWKDLLHKQIAVVFHLGALHELVLESLSYHTQIALCRSLLVCGVVEFTLQLTTFLHQEGVNRSIALDGMSGELALLEIRPSCFREDMLEELSVHALYPCTSELSFRF